MATMFEQAHQTALATYTRQDMGRLLGVSERQIDRMTAAKQIPGAFKFGRLVRFRRAIVDRWLNEE